MPYGKGEGVRKSLLAALLAGLLTAAGCGGGSGTTPGQNTVASSSQNVQPVAVNAGPTNNYVDGLFTSVTVCVPGTSNCQTITGVLVDTGSVGLRLLPTSAGGQLTLTLPQQTDASGNPMGECAQFSDGITWGGVRTADVKMAGEQASVVPIQVIADTGVPGPPGSCTSHGPPEDSQQKLLTNGILGVGSFLQDCGGGCTTLGGSPPPGGHYYSCPASGCQPAFESLAQQVSNPVGLFATDNNGVIIELPSVPTTGSPSVSGSMVFGIGTQSNNGLGNATVFTANPNTGNFTTVYKSQSYSSSFIDSGSNGIFFLDSGTTGMPTCSSTSNAPGFYCPSSSQNFSAINQGLNGATNTVNFSIANASTLFANGTNTAFNDLGGPNSTKPNSPTGFDWGLAFFFGRNVFTAIEGQNTPVGPGPYWAY